MRIHVFAALLDLAFQLTSSLNGVTEPALTKDGKKLFAIFTRPDRGELMRYEPGVGRFVAFPQSRGLSGGQTSFSRRMVSRSLTSVPGNEPMDHESGRQRPAATFGESGITAVVARRPADRLYGLGQKRIRPVRSESFPAMGLAQEPVPAPAWQGAPNLRTPDEKALIFGENGARFPIAATARLHRFDFETRKRSALPGPRACGLRECGLYRPICGGPHSDYRKLVLYDLRTSKRSELSLRSPIAQSARTLAGATMASGSISTLRLASTGYLWISIPERRMEKVAASPAFPSSRHSQLMDWIDSE